MLLVPVLRGLSQTTTKVSAEGSHVKAGLGQGPFQAHRVVARTEVLVGPWTEGISLLPVVAFCLLVRRES